MARWFHLPAFTILIVLFLVGPARATIQPPLRVDGTVLRDETGARVGLKGVAVQMVPYYAASPGGEQDAFLVAVADRNFAQRASEFEKLRRLGYTAIRVHIPGPRVYESELYETKSASVARITRIVDAAKAKGLVTILDSDATGDDMRDWRDYQPLFAALVSRLGNDPWVVWEPFNEPADYAQGAPNYRAGVEGIGAYLRSLGVSQPLILPSNGYEQDVEPALMDHILADAKAGGWTASGLLFGVHPYLDSFVGDPGDHGDTFSGAAYNALDHRIAANLAAYPLIVSEMGRYNNGITTTNATRAAYRWVAGLGAEGLNGLIAWDWDWALDRQASDPNAWTWDGLHLNAWGRQSNAEALSKMSFPDLSGRVRVVKAAIRGRILKAAFASPAGSGARVALTVAGRTPRRHFTVSRKFGVRRGARTLRWKLPGFVVRARSLTLRTTRPSGAPRRAVAIRRR